MIEPPDIGSSCAVEAPSTPASSAAGFEIREISSDAVRDDEGHDSGPEHDGEKTAAGEISIPPVRLATNVGLTAVVVMLTALTGWLGFRADRSHHSDQQNNRFLQAGRQGALDLTTVSYTEVDEDVRRVLDSATGAFHDDFAKRAQAFTDVIKHAQSKSVGTVTAAGLESVQDGHAQVLVATSVTTTTPAAPQQDQRAWRMRISVSTAGERMKVSNVEFVS